MDKSVQNYSKSAEYANKNRRITYRFSPTRCESCVGRAIILHDSGGN